MALNENLTFSDLGLSVRNSFNGLTAKHELLAKGTLLYKFTDWDIFQKFVEKEGRFIERTSGRIYGGDRKNKERDYALRYYANTYDDTNQFMSYVNEGPNVVREGDNRTRSEQGIYDETSPFWGTMNDLEDVLYYCKKAGKTLLDCIRQRNAVLHNWNGLNSLVMIELKQEIYGFTGTIGPQTEKEYAKKEETNSPHFTKPISLWGGANQVYLQNLERHHVTEIIPSGTVFIRDDIDAILNFLKTRMFSTFRYGPLGSILGNKPNQAI